MTWIIGSPRSNGLIMRIRIAAKIKISMILTKTKMNSNKALPKNMTKSMVRPMSNLESLTSKLIRSSTALSV